MREVDQPKANPRNDPKVAPIIGLPGRVAIIEVSSQEEAENP
jgi:hypothetical protein